jgi:hypothetical protein
MGNAVVQWDYWECSIRILGLGHHNFGWYYCVVNCSLEEFRQVSDPFYLLASNPPILSCSLVVYHHACCNYVIKYVKMWVCVFLEMMKSLWFCFIQKPGSFISRLVVGSLKSNTNCVYFSGYR